MLTITKRLAPSVVGLTIILGSSGALACHRWNSQYWFSTIQIGHSLPSDYVEHFKPSCERRGGIIEERENRYDEFITIFCSTYVNFVENSPLAPNYYQYFESFEACEAPYYVLQEPPQPQSCEKEGNPCNPATGNKFQTFTDYMPANTISLAIRRTYLSQNDDPNQFTKGWRHNYQSVMNPKPILLTLPVSSTTGVNSIGLQQSSAYSTAETACLNGWEEIKHQAFRGLLTSEQALYTGNNTCQIMKEGRVIASLVLRSASQSSFNIPPETPSQRIIRSDGSQYLFQSQNENWVDWQHPEAKLIPQGDNWLFTDAVNNQELYDNQGRLTQITTNQGLVTRLFHDLTDAEGGDNNNETLDKVTGPFGRTLAFNYQLDGKLASVNTPDGLIQYSYDTSENLTQVTYPDNTTETYHYEKTNFTHHLTGITDEKGVRFATWEYDDQGRAILSEHVGHTDKTTFIYNTDGTTTVTGASNDTRTYHFEWIKGSLKVTMITGERCSTCGHGYMKARSYDGNGFLASYTDWNGNLTTYTRDATGLELSRTEASGSPEARTISTEWHTNFRVPVKITQPGKVTEYHYDTQGRLLSQTTRHVQ